MSDDLKESTYEEKVQENRHKQVVELLRGLQKKEDIELKLFVSKNIDAIQALMSKVSELILLEKKETSAPQVNVTTDNKEVVAVFREIGKTINENLLAVKKCIDERPVYKEWEFKKSYTTGNSWDKIIATAKQ